MSDPKWKDATSSDDAGVPSGTPAADNDEQKDATTKAGSAEVGDAKSGSGATDAAGGVEDAAIEAEAAEVIEEAEAAIEAEASAEAAQAELAEWKDKYVRLHAEWDTYRRRTKEQLEAQKAIANEKLVGDLLPILDDLERTIDYAQKNGEAGLLSGVEAVLSKFVDTLKKDGVEVLNPVGEAFDALEAQAVGTVDDKSQLNETVAEVYQKGYKMGSKVLRPAMVTVTMGGPERPKEEETEND